MLDLSDFLRFGFGWMDERKEGGWVRKGKWCKL
jgi:hypothetical protein